MLIVHNIDASDPAAVRARHAAARDAVSARRHAVTDPRRRPRRRVRLGDAPAGGGGLLLLRAPDSLTRLLALDVLGTIVIVLLTVLSYLNDVSYYIDGGAGGGAPVVLGHHGGGPLHQRAGAGLVIESPRGASAPRRCSLDSRWLRSACTGCSEGPTIFEQLHPAGLVTGPGVILVLLASIASGSAEIATSAVLVIAFVLVTGSLSTHTIALAAWHSRDWSPPDGGGGGRLAPDRTASMPATGMRVLLAHDGSPGAEIATALAASLTWPEGSLIRLIGATDGDVQPFPDGEGAMEDLHAEPVRLAQAMTAAASRLRGPGLAVDHVVHRGEPSTAIADEAAAFGADLVIIGSRGLGPVETVVLGSSCRSHRRYGAVLRAGGPRGARPARGAGGRRIRVQ